MADKKLNKDELKKVSGGAVYRAKVTDTQKVRNKPNAGGQTPKVRRTGRG